MKTGKRREMKNKVQLRTKLEYIELIEKDGITPYKAVQELRTKCPEISDHSQVRRWYKSKEKIRKANLGYSRIPGAGRKPPLGVLE